MKATLSSIATAVAILFTAPVGRAQDGILFSTKPPIVVRLDGDTVSYHFTNTSDKPLHGITINSVKDGQQQSVVIIDTIEPHKTVAVEMVRLINIVGGRLSDATLDLYELLESHQISSGALGWGLPYRPVIHRKRLTMQRGFLCQAQFASQRIGGIL
jgi:hypothetical protein